MNELEALQQQLSDALARIKLLEREMSRANLRINLIAEKVSMP